ncbi:unnamed protein product [Brugia timori]|uniref:Acetyltransferase n=1 Tax=Brugia timori TaxID=42155 RepID=A0A0R3QZZ7_9BILA|nr:unnamed protein product [Brugia timori]
MNIFYFPGPIKSRFDHLKPMDGPTEIYEQLNLCIFPERFCLEPRGRDGGLVSDTYLEIDRNTGKLGLISQFVFIRYV